MRALDSDVGQLPQELGPERFVGLTLHDGLNAAEERVMAHLAQLTNVPFVGASAGDGMKFERTTVFANFRPRGNTSALALLEPAGPYSILETQSFVVRDEVLTATSVDEATRTVKRFDDKPALQEYAARLGIPPARAEAHFPRHPVGIVMDDGEPFVRAPQRVSGQDIVFFCQILQGARVHLLEARDIVKRTREDLQAALGRFGRVSALIDFDCAQRVRELDNRGQLQAYARLFEHVPSIGFATYGESYIGHVNQTAALLLLG